MRQRIPAVLLAFTLATLPALAADGAAKAPAAKPAAGAKSLDPAKGRFHLVHTKKLKLDCISCHSSEQKDVLFVRKDEPLQGGMPQVDRQFCTSCHAAPAKPTWYGAASR